MKGRARVGALVIASLGLISLQRPARAQAGDQTSDALDWHPPRARTNAQATDAEPARVPAPSPPSTDSSSPPSSATDGPPHGPPVPYGASLLGPTSGDPPRRPVFSGYLMFGAAFGGTTIVRFGGQTLATGRGYGLSLGTLFMPVWLADRFGLGVRAEIGLKRDSIDDVKTSDGESPALLRFPVLGMVSTLTRIGDRFFILAEAGILKDLGIGLSPSGLDAALPSAFRSTVGFVGQAGLMYHETPHLAADVYVRYVRLDYESGAWRIDADSVGIYLGFHVVLPASFSP